MTITADERDENVVVGLRLVSDNLRTRTDDSGPEFGSRSLRSEILFLEATATLLEELAVQLAARGIDGSRVYQASTAALAQASQSRSEENNVECDCAHAVEKHGLLGCRMSEKSEGEFEPCDCLFQTGFKTPFRKTYGEYVRTIGRAELGEEIRRAEEPLLDAADDRVF